MNKYLNDSPAKSIRTLVSNYDEMNVSRSQFFVNLFENKLSLENQKRNAETANNFFTSELELTKIDNYMMGKFMGQGANAMVREAKHSQTGHTVAIKVYDKAQLEKNQNIKRSVQSEIKILNYLSKSHNDSDIHTLESSLERDYPMRRGHNCIMKLYDAMETSR